MDYHLNKMDKIKKYSIKAIYPWKVLKLICLIKLTSFSRLYFWLHCALAKLRRSVL